jgi:predicted 2-oxoglutarate/Fe(II)-dependent dioxygenase YbiX
LDLHLDSTSQFTTVIVLTDNFKGGEFILSNNQTSKEKEIELKMGEGISFDGSKIYHGVNPVVDGIRCALNIWMTNTDYKYKDVSKKTLL